MSIPFGNHDRAKASEHGVVLRRRLSAPVGDVVRVLPLIAGRLTEKLFLSIPSAGSTVTLPIDVVMAPLAQEWRWLLKVRSPSKDAGAEFFDGEIRLPDLPAAATEVMLVGRFTVLDEFRRQHLGEDEVRRIAEDNLMRILESLVLEVDATIADRP